MLMASEWRPSTWGKEISLEYGKALRDYKDAEGQYRVYRSNGPVGWTSKPLAPGPGIILGRKGVYRGVEYSKDPFFVIDTAYYVKPKKLLILLVKPGREVAGRFGLIRRCPVCDHRLLGRGQYCGECGSKVSVS